MSAAGTKGSATETLRSNARASGMSSFPIPPPPTIPSLRPVSPVPM